MAEPALAALVLFPLARDVIRVTGRDRKSWLDGLVTCKVSAVEPGRAAFGLLLTKQGKVVSDLFLVDDGQQLRLGAAPGRGPVLSDLLDRHLVMEDAELQSEGRAGGFALLFGAQADAAVRELGSGLAWGRLHLDAVETFVVSWSASEDLAGVAARLGARVGGADELDARLAAVGVGRFGVDYAEGDNPHEAALDRLAVDWSKGCYLGQEVVCMQDMRGKLKRRLVRLSAPRDAAIAAGAEVVDGTSGSVAGVVKSVHLRGPDQLLLAALSPPSPAAGAGLEVGGRPVRVVAASGES